MKILHLSHSREKSGVGEATRHYQKAMLSAGLDVAARPIYLNNSTFTPEEKLLELEKKSAHNCDVVIQHVLPRYMSYNGNYRNIGFYVSETWYKQSPWVNHLNLMDELWTPSNDFSVQTKKPQYIVPHACDSEEYQKIYNRLPSIEKTYNFYFVGEFTRRKNLAALLKAFHLEFRSEPVNLILKVTKPGMSGKELFDEVKHFCDKIKEGLKLQPKHCKSEIVITDYLSRHDLLRLHRSCDCFCNTSYGEAWSYPTFDAAAMGNFVISNKFGGPRSYLQHYNNSLIIDGITEPVFAAGPDTVPELYHGSEYWYSINIEQLRNAMRFAYKERSKTPNDGIALANKYSYEVIGELIKQRLLND